MRNEKEILKQNSLTSGIIIKLVLGVAFVAVCVWAISKIGASALSVVGIYILIRSIFKIIRLAIGIIYSILSVLFLLAVISIIILFIL